jgi:peptidyl-prolyl cis-trans isomerase C
MNHFSRLVFYFFLLTSVGSSAHADNTVFARQGGQVLTQEELDAAFSRIPEQYRMAFIRDGEKVDQLVQNLLRYKLIVADARAHGFDKEPLMEQRMQLALDEAMTEAWLARVVDEAPEADYEAIAYENYLASPELFQTEEMVDVSHILVESGKKRNEEEALDLATRLQAELLGNPELFGEYVEEYSDDPGKVSNNGRYAQVKRGQMVKPFEEQAFSMREEGEISEPVKTSFGYHIIRLNQRIPTRTKPFEDVKGPLIEEARKAYLSQYRQDYILKQSSGTIEIPDGAVEAMVKRQFGENLELAPDIYNQ